MASQAKFSEMLSQFSNRDVSTHRHPPPKRQRQKLNLQYSQLNVQNVEVTTNKFPGIAEAEKPARLEQDSGWVWSDDDDDIDNMELDALLSQYDKPPEPLVQQKEELTNTSQVKASVDNTKVTVKLDIHHEKNNSEKPKLVHKVDLYSNSNVGKSETNVKIEQVTHKVELKVTALASTSKAAAPKKDEAKKAIKEPIKCRKTSTDCESLDPIFDFKFKTKADLVHQNEAADPKYLENKQAFLQELTKTEALLSEMFGSLMNVPNYSQHCCKAKNIQQHWEYRSLNADRWFPEERAHEVRLQLNLLDSLFKNCNLPNPSSTSSDRFLGNQEIALSCNVEPPQMQGTPLILQQIAQICDIAAIRPDYFSFGPLICASIQFISSVLLNPENTNSEICFWILQRCADIEPVPCVLMLLLDATHRILASKPNFLQVVCTSNVNQLRTCFMAKIGGKLASLIFGEETEKRQQVDQYSKSLKDKCSQKEDYTFRLASKITEILTSLHFAPSFKLPSCLSLASSAECLKCLFKLSSRIVVSYFIVKLADDEQQTLFEKFGLVMWWMSTNNAQFKHLTRDLRAELYYFLAKRAKSKSGSLEDLAANHLVSTYPSWGMEQLSVRKDVVQRASSVAESSSSTPFSERDANILSEKIESDSLSTPKEKRKCDSPRTHSTHKSLRFSLKKT